MPRQGLHGFPFCTPFFPKNGNLARPVDVYGRSVPLQSWLKPMAQTHPSPSWLSALPGRLFGLAVLLLLAFGWSQRNNHDITAESGLGYWLGIAGGSLMLTLLLYPLSKRVRLLTRLIPLRYWFGLHMTLGVIGPVLILFHANFQLGSANSNIALFCMLLVAGSGLVGRYFYSRIHHGLYGRKISLQELAARISQSQKDMAPQTMAGETGQAAALLQKLITQLECHRQHLLQPTHSLGAILRNHRQLARTLRQIKREMRRDRQLRAQLADRLDAFAAYQRSLQKLASFYLYERLFSLWHLFHLPLFIMMILTAVVHVFAVHIY